jgi:hypothetical protein
MSTQSYLALTPTVRACSRIVGRAPMFACAAPSSRSVVQRVRRAASRFRWRSSPFTTPAPGLFRRLGLSVELLAVQAVVWLVCSLSLDFGVLERARTFGFPGYWLKPKKGTLDVWE